MRAPAGAYIIAVFFTAVWLFSLGSVIYVLFFRLTPEMRHQLTGAAPALASLALADLNGLLMTVASWLLVGMRRIGAGLMLASTVLLAGLCALSWPVLLHRLSASPTHEGLRPLLLGGSNLVLHIAATVYAFRLNSKGLLR
ncbi:MAG TPA: hypothetical protein VGM02_16720 [Acidobacteriaceae bacterium]